MFGYDVRNPAAQLKGAQGVWQQFLRTRDAQTAAVRQINWRNQWMG